MLFGDLSELPAGSAAHRCTTVMAVLDALDPMNSASIPPVHPPAVLTRIGSGRVDGDRVVTETLEMLADPYGNRLVAAVHPLDRAKRVNYLLEVCDPALRRTTRSTACRCRTSTPATSTPCVSNRSLQASPGAINGPLAIAGRVP